MSDKCNIFDFCVRVERFAYLAVEQYDTYHDFDSYDLFNVLKVAYILEYIQDKFEQSFCGQGNSLEVYFKVEHTLRSHIFRGLSTSFGIKTLL